MQNINLIIFICFAIPMSMMLLIFKGNSRLLCIFLLLGMLIGVLSGEINGIFASYNNMSLQNISVNIAPLVEETLKAIPIIFISFLIKPSKQNLAEYSLAVGVGFAVLENVSMLLSFKNISYSYVFLRSIGAGLMHGICTLTVGIAMRNVIDKKNVYISGTIAALCISVIYHSIYNMLITSKYAVVGVLMPIITFLIIITINIIQNKEKRSIL